eukprot:scaffold22064_cov112-Isochrysis_galbana.AAC.2
MRAFAAAARRASQAAPDLLAWFLRVRAALALRVLRLLLAPPELAALRDELPRAGDEPSLTLGLEPSLVLPTRTMSRFGSLRRLRTSALSHRDSLFPSRDVSLAGDGAYALPASGVPPVRVVVFGSINIDLRADAKGRWPKYDATTVGTFSQSAGGKGPPARPTIPIP